MLYSPRSIAGLIAIGTVLGVTTAAMETQPPENSPTGSTTSPPVPDSATSVPTAVDFSFDDANQREFSFYIGLMGDDTVAPSGTPVLSTVLGVHVSRADAALRSHLGIDGEFGLLVTHVRAASAAAQAELRKFDVLMEFDGQQLVNRDQLMTLVRSHQPGDQVPVRLFRGGKSFLVEVMLQAGEVHDAEPAVLTDELINKLDPRNHFRDFRFRHCRQCHDVASGREATLESPEPHDI